MSRTIKTTISVTEKTWKKLSQLKIEDDFYTFDELISYLIDKYISLSIK